MISLEGKSCHQPAVPEEVETSSIPPASPSDEGPPYSSDTITSHASVQTNSSVTEAPTLTMHVNPGEAYNVSHALNSSSPVTNNIEGPVNLKLPPSQETVNDCIHALTKMMMDANIELTAASTTYTAELNYICKESSEVISKLTERLEKWINLNNNNKYDES